MDPIRRQGKCLSTGTGRVSPPQAIQGSMSGCNGTVAQENTSSLKPQSFSQGHNGMVSDVPIMGR